MEDLLVEFEKRISKLLSLFNDARDGIGSIPVSKDVRDYIDRFVESYEAYKTVLNGNNAEEIAESANRVCIYGEAFGRNLKKIDVDDKTKVLANKLESSSSELREIIKSSPILTAPLTDKHRLALSDDMQNYQSFRKQLKQVIQNQKIYDERIKKTLDDSEKRAILLEEKLKTLEYDYTKELKIVSDLYESELVKIEEKNAQINKLLGDAAGRVIVSEYAVSAEQEKVAAEWLRVGSIFCMAVIIGIAGYSFWESIHQSFDLSNSLLRLALVFLLSVPAAYLARESTKHRQQQYTHLQTSLDLKAINPYIASLPEEEQHKIKSEIAQRIFAPKDFQSISNESYPINSQEVIMALISKFGNDKDKQID
ncbi:hypothetical protein [Psychrobacter sp. DM8]|uniref:hypothetical protein n=1 Tax=Psychrobacter sp. DM8 TaxID=3440636 RepID=UPI003F503742